MFARIFTQFLILGCVAFGGPMAHLAWFERVFVERLKWLSHARLAELIALCQALPGPSSSQTAMGIGYVMHGWRGLFAAWLGFGLPPALLMLGAAHGAVSLPEALRVSLTHGMKVAVVGVIAVALWRMARTLLKRPAEHAATLGYGLLFLLFPGPWVMLMMILLVALVSLRQEGMGSSAALAAGGMLKGHSRQLLIALPGLFLGLQLLGWLIPGPWTALAAAFYQTGMLVFGGGHVILPLLEGLVVQPQWVGAEEFLLGYGLAQMVPGPLVSFAAYLGAAFPVADPLRPLAGLLAFACIYLPSFLLMGLLLPRWHAGASAPHWQAVLRRLHPLVIGLLLATWVQPVILSAIGGWRDVLVAAMVTLALACFGRFTLLILLATALAHIWIL
jgi:chromate transporter